MIPRVFLSILILCGLFSAWGARAEPLDPIPESALRRFDECVKSDDLLYRQVQRLGDWLNLRSDSPEILVRAWFESFTHLPQDFDYRRPRRMLSRIEFSLHRLKQLTSERVETALIRLIDAAVGERCPRLGPELLEANARQMMHARFYIRELEQARDLLQIGEKLQPMLRERAKQAERIESLRCKLGL